ncbi:MAG: ABC transporter substrate binding protein [Desulfovibrionaceae bacterium]|nr:ABC transporter substrate binding protein [Desulfovibrionaceae bacterium]
MRRGLVAVLTPALFALFALTAWAGRYEGKKILFVDSYNAGYAWSDGVIEGARSVLDRTRVEFRVLHMDTKRNPSEEFKRRAGLAALEAVRSFAPDVVIASDDAASKYLAQPFLKDGPVPVVFCGINWDASAYGYPYANATGMIEVDLAEEMKRLLRRYAKGDRTAYISVPSLSEDKITRIYNERFYHGDLKMFLVRTFDEFKVAFVAAQKEADMLIVSNYAGIDRWDPAEAEAFIVQNTRIPTGARLDWMAPYALITLAKVPEEQGVWSARTALLILDGTRPSSIPVVTNREAGLIINLRIAERLGIVFDRSLLKNATIIGRGPGSGPGTGGRP